jgi:hypothetical protein
VQPVCCSAVLLVAGGLPAWTSSYINNEVHTQLAAHQIYFPAANRAAVAAPEFQAMRQYGGQLMTTGAQADDYADHFIANHLKVIGGGKTYAQLSAESMAQPANTQPATQVATVFKGETLRGLLLNACAFGTMGMIAGIAAVGAFISAGVLLLLCLLGIFHARRVSPTEEILGSHGTRFPLMGFRWLSELIRRGSRSHLASPEAGTATVEGAIWPIRRGATPYPYGFIGGKLDGGRSPVRWK